MVRNGMLWKDLSGLPIHAHGGGMLQSGPYIYWFGENREGRKRVSCYRSSDLTHWEFRGDVLTLDSPFEPIDMRTSPELVTDPDSGRGANIERPKVIYNAKTNQYVMWMHWENGKDYSAARCAVATCNTIDGDYVYHGSFNPIGAMSRDCTLFVDDDGTAYFISAARENADLHMYRLSSDYLTIDEQVRTLWPGQYREAPALMKRNGVYFMVTSGCTGWEPNQGKYAYSHSLTGSWSELYDLGGPTTYDTQPTYILPLQGSSATSYLYLGDRWHPKDYHRSSYVMLPIEFPTDTTMRLYWADTVHIDTGKGTVATASKDSGLWRIRTGSHRYLAPDSFAAVTAQTLNYVSAEQLWLLEPDADADQEERIVRIRNKARGRYMESREAAGSTEAAAVTLSDRSGRSSQQWRMKADAKEGWFVLTNRDSGHALTLSREHEGKPRLQELREDGSPRPGQRFLLVPHYGTADAGEE